MSWRFHGSPHVLALQAVRLNIPQHVVRRAEVNQELGRIQQLLAKCFQWYFGEKAAPGAVENTLAQAEQECAKLHALAAAADAQLEEAWQAFGLLRPERGYRVEAASEPLNAMRP